MNYPIFFESKKSKDLFGLSEDFNFISNLYLKKKLPKVLMLTGNKGVGKATLINHFLHSILDEQNYDKNKHAFQANSSFANKVYNNIFPNVIYINGADFKSVKIDDIRNLKKKFFNHQFLVNIDLLYLMISSYLIITAPMLY